MAGNGFFEKSIQGTIPSVLAVAALTSNATAIRNAVDWVVAADNSF
jgi:hypothetical protein